VSADHHERDHDEQDEDDHSYTDKHGWLLSLLYERAGNLGGGLSRLEPDRHQPECNDARQHNRY
jgi:hypothetical protein